MVFVAYRYNIHKMENENVQKPNKKDKKKRWKLTC